MTRTACSCVQLLLAMADEAGQGGTSPLPILQQAKGVAARARDINAKNALVYLSLGQIARTGAEWRSASASRQRKTSPTGRPSIRRCR